MFHRASYRGRLAHPNRWSAVVQRRSVPLPARPIRAPSVSAALSCAGGVFANGRSICERAGLLRTGRSSSVPLAYARGSDWVPDAGAAARHFVISRPAETVTAPRGRWPCCSFAVAFGLGKGRGFGYNGHRSPRYRGGDVTYCFTTVYRYRPCEDRAVGSLRDGRGCFGHMNLWQASRRESGATCWGR